MMARAAERMNLNYHSVVPTYTTVMSKIGFVYMHLTFFGKRKINRNLILKKFSFFSITTEQRQNLPKDSKKNSIRIQYNK